MALLLTNNTPGVVTITDLITDTQGTSFTIAASPTAVEMVGDNVTGATAEIFSVSDIRNSVDLQTAITAGDVTLTQSGKVISDTSSLGIEDPFASGLPGVLATDNTTGGTDIALTDGDAVQVGSSNVGIFNGTSQFATTGVIFDFFDSGDDVYMYQDGGNFNYIGGTFKPSGIQLDDASFVYSDTGAGFSYGMLWATPTATRTQTFPDASGTIALTSDIVTEDLAATLVAGNITSGTNIQMTTTDAIEFGSATNTISKDPAKNIIVHDAGLTHQFDTPGFRASIDDNFEIANTVTSARWLLDPDFEHISGRNAVGKTFFFQLPATLTATSTTATFQDADGTVAYTSDITSGTLVSKSGVEAFGGFAGTPLTKAVTFGAAFGDALYSVSIIGADARSWTVDSQTSAGFTINSNSSTALTADVSWTAIKHGETS